MAVARVAKGEAKLLAMIRRDDEEVAEMIARMKAEEREMGFLAGVQAAFDFIMGDAPAGNDMAAVYRQKTFDSRLRKLTDYVHGWLTGTVVLKLVNDSEFAQRIRITHQHGRNISRRNVGYRVPH